MPCFAAAQAASQSELALCASLESAELKLACFEALTVKYSNEQTPAAELADEPPASPTPAVNADEDEQSFTATVVKVERDWRLRRHTFIMENGEIWRQMESGMLSYPKDGPFEVEIRRGFMGDYQMRIDDQDRMTRIVQLR